MKSTWSVYSKRFGRAAIVGTSALAVLAGVVIATKPIAAKSTVANSTLDAEPDAVGGTLRVRLITSTQYTNSLRSIFGVDVVKDIRFAPIRRVDGLTAIGASTAMITPSGFQMTEDKARLVANIVVDSDHRKVTVPCEPRDAKSADEACAKHFFNVYGPLLFRRPLSHNELNTYAGAASEAASNMKSFYGGLSLALAGMISSPKFLFVIENAESDPANPGQKRLDGWSKASRLSEFLWDASPDSELLRAATAGELHTSAGLQRQVDRMLQSPRLENGVRAFFSDMLALDAFDALAKDPVIYPAYSLRVAGDAREQLLRTITDLLITRNGDYRDLFTTRRTFLNGDLATLYRLPVARGEGWQPYDLPTESNRAGILTQIGFLSVHAHAGRSSATRRGRGIRELLLCQHVPDPPPNVDFSIIEDPSAKLHTARERLDAHASDPTCAGCHRLTDPIGLSLENFDGAGQYRLTENNAVIDTSGELDGVQFKDAIGLASAMRDNPTMKSCLVGRLYSYAAGRSLKQHDTPFLNYLEGRFHNDDYRFRALLKTIATSNSLFALAPSAGSGKASFGK